MTPVTGCELADVKSRNSYSQHQVRAQIVRRVSRHKSCVGDNVVREFDEKGDEGIALISVLWALVLLSIIGAALIIETRSSTRIALNMTESAVLRAAADAGIQRAILELSDARFSWCI